MANTPNNRQGRTIKATTAGESFQAYIPPPLPPVPPVNLESLEELYGQAANALGKLDSLLNALPNTGLFLYMYVRKEAVLSSQIEGTQSSISDLLLYENQESPGVPLDDVEEVCQYVAAMTYGMERLHEGFPLSLRLLKEIHQVLMTSGRGSDKSPGEFRRSQNWIGGTRPGNALFVPPPPEYLMECLGNLETFLHAPTPSGLIKAAIAHVQFETIHPFLDGNGRLGRLLIPFILMVDGVLETPGLYLSLYFKKNRSDYYRLLGEVREEGGWETWLEFFLQGVVETAHQGIHVIEKITQLIDTDRQKIETLKRPKVSALRVFESLQTHPITSVKTLAQNLNMSFPTATASLDHLCTLGIVEEVTGKERDRRYAYTAYLALLTLDD